MELGGYWWEMALREDISPFLGKSTENLLKREVQCRTFNIQSSLLLSKAQQKAEKQKLTAPLPDCTLQHNLHSKAFHLCSASETHSLSQ